MKAEAKREGAKRIGARLAAAALALAAATAAPAQATAQQSTNRVEAFRDWSVFTADAGGPVCWIVTQPQSSVAKRDGRPVQVQRGDIYLTVAVRPRQGVDSEIAMVAGYPFRDGSTVTAEIGSRKFELFTEGENAWTYPNDDGDILTAMKAGAAIVMTGVSSRGTTTIDRFSLLGFTDALTSAQTRCK